MRLVITGEEPAAHETPLERDEVVIGRAPESDVRLENRDVSRRHARLFRDGLGWVVEDLGSASGTRIDGVLVTGRRPLAPGESLEIGSYVLTLVLDDTELPTLPPHPAGVAAEPAPLRRGTPARRWPAVALLVLLAVTGGWFWNARRVLAARCRAANEAWAQRDWTTAGEAMRALLADGAACPSMNLAALASAADTNVSASRVLDGARRLLTLRDWDGALAAVAGAPPGSALSEELRLVEAQARRGQADTLAAALEAALAAGDVAAAGPLLERLAHLGLDEQQLLAWHDRLAALAETAPPPAPPAPPTADTPAPKAAPEQAPATNRRPLAERDADARRLYEAAGNDIRASDMLGAVDKLQLALEADPSRSLRCQVLRSLGVAYARSGKKLETARTYKAYLDCDPKAPDRPQLERVVREARP